MLHMQVCLSLTKIPIKHKTDCVVISGLTCSLVLKFQSFGGATGKSESQSDGNQ